MERGETEVAGEAPAVVAVMVTCNPGSWLEESLEALGSQDYPNLKVLVIDAASTDDPLQRVANALPEAFVRRLSRNPGYAAAANRALRIVQGASHFLMCHDDVAPDRDAVSRMMQQAQRENAEVVTPKLVGWADPVSLLGLGGTSDNTCAFLPAVDHGDADQGQLDTPREVFVANGGCLLIKADLFERLGGFDGAISRFGEDIDFSWRAQLAGARVVTAPAARVRHLEAMSNGMRFLPHGEEDEEAIELGHDALRRRHRLRTALKVKRGPRLLAMVVRLVLLNVAEVAYCLFTGKTNHAGAVSAAWWWNLVHWRGLLKARRQVWRSRTVSDRVVSGRLGSSRQRIEGVLRREWELRSQRLRNENWDGRDVVGVLRNLTFATFATIAVIWVAGSRELLQGGIPEAGRMIGVDPSGLDSLRYYFGLLPSDGFGAAVAVSPAWLLAAAIGLVSPGQTDLVQSLVALGMLPLGMFGIARLAKALESPRARLAAMAAYAAIPLPYAAIGWGRLDSLIAYAVAPWILAWLLKGEGDRPFGAVNVRRRLHVNFRRRHDDDDELERIDLNALAEAERASSLVDKPSASQPDVHSKQHGMRDRVSYLLLRRVVPLSLLTLTAGAVAPQMIPAVATTGLLIFLGSLVAGSSEEGSTSRIDVLVMSLAGPVVALAVLAPSIISSANGLGDVLRIAWTSAPPPSLVDMFLLSPGKAGSWLTIGLLMAGLPALFLGSGWRFRLAVKMWFVVIGTCLICWAGSSGWFGDAMADPRIFLTFAGAAAAVNVAVGVQALSIDLRRYAFGWRQLLPVVAVLGVVVSLVPIASRAGDGSWHAPSVAAPQVLSWMHGKAEEGSFRTLWLGDANALPGVPRITDDDLASAIAVDGAAPRSGAAPTATGKEGEVAISSAVDSARSAQTVSLGRALAPYGVRYVVVPERTGVAGGTSQEAAPPPGLVEALDAQLDLVSIDSDESLNVFENREWLPIRSQLSPEATLAARNFTGSTTDLNAYLGESVAVLNDGRKVSTGVLEAGQLYVSEARSEGWQLSIDGRRAQSREAFGWASTFQVDTAGDARLSYSAPVAVPITQTAVVIAWLALFVMAVKFRARRSVS